MAKIIHYREKCIGCYSCVEHAPSYWKMDDDGLSTLLGSSEKKGIFLRDIDESDVEKNKKAAKDCPVNIIKVVE